MTNMEYVSSLIKDTDIIYIDTSALMNTDQLEIFINNIQSLLILESKKLVVQHEVWMELQRHVEGDDTEKRILHTRFWRYYISIEKFSILRIQRVISMIL